MGQLFRYFVYASWWVALCATAMALLTWFELTGQIFHWPLIVFVTGSTLVIYNVNMLSGIKGLKEKGTDSSRHQWCIENVNLLRINTGIGVFLSLISILLIDLNTLIVLLPFGVLSIAYVLPIIPIKNHRRKLREFGLTKIFMIATVWTGVTTLVPLIEAGIPIFKYDSLWIMAERWLFILAITIPFDIRDIENDRKNEVKTIPSVIGWKRSVLLSIIILLGFMALVWLRLGNASPLLTGYSIATALTITAVALANPKRSDMYCSFWLEGTMMLLFLAVIFLN